MQRASVGRGGLPDIPCIPPWPTQGLAQMPNGMHPDAKGGLGLNPGPLHHPARGLAFL